MVVTKRLILMLCAALLCGVFVAACGDSDLFGGDNNTQTDPPEITTLSGPETIRAGETLIGVFSDLASPLAASSRSSVSTASPHSPSANWFRAMSSSASSAQRPAGSWAKLRFAFSRLSRCAACAAWRSPRSFAASASL